MLEVTEVKGKAGEMFAEITKTFGMVPNLFKAMALKPDILEANFMKFKAIMTQGELPRDLKEMVAVVVSQANSCSYCVDAHSAALKMMGFPREKILQLLDNVNSADISPAHKTLLNLAIKATREPHKISESEVQQLRDLGYSDANFVEFISVVDLFTSFNIFLDSLQVEIDFPQV